MRLKILGQGDAEIVDGTLWGVPFDGTSDRDGNLVCFVGEADHDALRTAKPREFVELVWGSAKPNEVANVNAARAAWEG